MSPRRRFLTLLRQWVGAARIGWDRLTAPPDTLLLDQSQSGELTVARLRLVVVGVLMVGPFVALSRGAVTPATRLLVVGSTGVLIGAGVLHVAARQHWLRSTLSLVSSAFDPLALTAILGGLVVIGRADLGVQSPIVFALYVLAVASTAMRSDPRSAIVGGLTALVGYGGILAVVSVTNPLAATIVSPSSAYGRLIVLAAATVASWTAVHHTLGLRTQSAKDALTGLVTRGFFRDAIRIEFSRSERYKRSLSIALIDVDHFKSFNDRFGHTVGDEVLRLIAKMLTSGRESDLVGRWGGEEFIVAFPETDVDGAMIRAEDLRKVIEPSSVTVSVGVATYPADGADLDAVINVADERLYAAKRSGRNRVVGPETDTTQVLSIDR